MVKQARLPVRAKDTLETNPEARFLWKRKAAGFCRLPLSIVCLILDACQGIRPPGSSTSSRNPFLFHPPVCVPDFMFYRHLTAAGAGTAASALSAVSAASVRVPLSCFHTAQNVPDQIAGIPADRCNQNHVYQNSHIRNPFYIEPGADHFIRFQYSTFGFTLEAQTYKSFIIRILDSYILLMLAFTDDKEIERIFPEKG